ncbi:MAG: SUMF1/EgtB/PvdO family nonheme iron enzyme [Elainella sp.]
MGRNWAITIGINQYRNLQRLDFAQRDGEAMRAWFQQELGVQTVYHFSDDSPPIPQDFGPALDSQPTYATLRRFFRVRFEQPFLQPGDNLWFFFAGHGKRHADRDYLMPQDADPGDVEGSAIALNYVTERLRRSGADNVILLIDACRNTGQRDGTGFGQEKQPGVITLFACSPSESSYEIAELQQGAFTHALLEGLRIEGEGNCATVERLYQRLRQTVHQLTQQYRRAQQTPYGVVEPPTKYHLILLPRKANLSDIVTLKNDALRAEVQQDLKLAKQLWIRVLSVSPADGDAIEGIERLARVSAVPPVAPLVPSIPIVPPLGEPARIVSPSDPNGQRDAVPEMPPKPEPSSPIKTFEFEVINVDATGREASRRRGEARFYEVNLGNGIMLEMVAIPGGQFLMGSPETEEGRHGNESPQHLVTVPAFWMGKYAITQAQWKAIAAWPKVKQYLDPDPSRFKGANRPVEKVFWHDAVEFCTRLSQKTGQEYRLPSEAEWGYACRAGTTTPFYFGETITTDLVNFNGNYTYSSAPKGQYREQTIDVGSFPPNAFGLYDMHGNVWEWCLEHWHGNYNGAPSDGRAWVSGGDAARWVLRGGSWYFDPRNCRSAVRYDNVAGERYDDFGFRVVCSASRTS